jgi:predicted amidophosphoribosyltransferase
MGLFRRKRASEEPEDRCPQCGEPLPEEAVQCMMCGTDLRPLQEMRSSDDLENLDAGASRP